MHYDFILLEFSHRRTCWSGRMNVNGPCLLSLQQFQIIEVAFPMYAYYTKAPLWIREKKNKKLVKWQWRQQMFLCTLSGKVPAEDAALGQKKRFSVWKWRKMKNMFLGRNLFGNISHLFLEPDLEAFKPSPCRSKSLCTATDRLSLNLTSKILTEDNDLQRQSSTLNSGEMVGNVPFLSARRTESWWLLQKFQTFQQPQKLI